MSELVVRAKSLRKAYRIGSRTEAPWRYKTLRDELVQFATWPLRRLRGQGKTQTELFWALDDVSFDIAKGEIVGIIGRNGAGKSTLLKLLSRITAPTGGRVELYGRVGSLLEVGTGFHPELTGRENIYLSGAILGMRRREIDRKLDEIVAFAEVEKFLDTPAKRYSSGMYVRLGFAVAAHLEPEILIIDEVLAVGDALFQRKCLGKMTDVAKAGRTILFVSHNMTAIRSMCTRVITLHGGRMAGDDSPGDGVARYLWELREGVYSQTWEGASAPRNSSALLREVSAVDESGAKLEQIYTDSTFAIEVEFQVEYAGSTVGLTLMLLDSENNYVFCSINNLEPTWYGKPMPSGVYTSRCVIPANLLNNGWFTVNINLLGKGYSDVATATEVLRFEVLDGPSIRGDYFGSYSGLIRPKLDWNTKRVEGGAKQ